MENLILFNNYVYTIRFYNYARYITYFVMNIVCNYYDLSHKTRKDSIGHDYV